MLQIAFNSTSLCIRLYLRWIHFLLFPLFFFNFSKTDYIHYRHILIRSDVWFLLFPFWLSSLRLCIELYPDDEFIFFFLLIFSYSIHWFIQSITRKVPDILHSSVFTSVFFIRVDSVLKDSPSSIIHRNINECWNRIIVLYNDGSLSWYIEYWIYFYFLFFFHSIKMNSVFVSWNEILLIFQFRNERCILYIESNNRFISPKIVMVSETSMHWIQFSVMELKIVDPLIIDWITWRTHTQTHM